MWVVLLFEWGIKVNGSRLHFIHSVIGRSVEIIALSCGFWGFYDLLGVCCSTLLGNC